MNTDKTKEVIEGLVQDYKNSIEKGEEHINLINQENVKLNEAKDNLNIKKQKEIDEMIRFNDSQTELILEEIFEKKQKLKYYKKMLKEHEQIETD